MHPPLFIYIQKDDKYRSMTWIGCEIKRPMAEPKSSYEPIGW